MTIIKAGFLPVAVLALLGSAQARDLNPCSENSVNGTFGFVSSVRPVPPQNSPPKYTGRSRLIGIISYDGAGKVTLGGITLAASGKTVPYTGSGTYKVDGRHCTGSVSFQLGDKGASKWDFVIVSGGRELLTIIETAANASPFSQVKR